MLTFYDPRAKHRQAKTELVGGELVVPFESPKRVDMILGRINETQLGAVQGIKSYGLDPIKAVHDEKYVTFISQVWDEWKTAGRTGEVIPVMWPTRRTRDDYIPHIIDGKVGYYALSGETSIEAGTWDAATASVDTALTAMYHVLEHQDAAFGLCRPPGHHAAVDLYGGYCFFNNAAIAAQEALNHGAKRVSILDVDYHHGNGTQQIFYQRSDVLYSSLHCTPLEEFPYYLGLADEKGKGQGEGYNDNHPLMPGATYGDWLRELDAALLRIDQYAPDLLIVSLGVDTYEADPIGTFKLKSPDFSDYGRRLKQVNRPTVFLMEGGYAVDAIGVNTVNVLSSFERA